MTYQRMDFTKGHATENDFVLVPDPDGQHPLDVAAVRRIADRRSGIGADGVIRVVPTRHAQDDSVRAMADRAPWFMDYRNADGSLAAVCGNGTRVFAAYLRREGLQDGDAFMIGTRAGVRAVRFEGDLICVELGAWRLSEEEVAQQQGFDAMVHLPSGPLPGLSVEMGNPNTVVALPDSLELDAVDLRSAPRVEPASLEGSNVMFVQMLGEGRISLRAYERGVGETRSCGSGACAAAAATQWWAGRVETDAIWAVDVPGGRLEVRLHDGDRAELCGPAVLVADGTAELA